MGRYRFVERMSEGLVGLKLLNGERQLWAKCVTRKSHACRVTGGDIEALSVAYRPQTNGSNRMDRISEAGMNKLEGKPND